MTPKQLIDRQLGELCDINNSTREKIMSCARNIHGWLIESAVESVDIIEREKERRELLERLIKNVKTRCQTIAYDFVVVSNAELRRLKQSWCGKDIELIEKILGLPWNEIIKTLEETE